MANVSSADGTVTIEAQNEETVRKVFSAILPMASDEHWYYGIYTDQEAKTLTVKQDENSRFSANVTFWGDGRWSMDNTLDSYMKAVESVLKEKNPELLAKIEKEDFELQFNYVDVEFGCCYLAEPEATITHKAGTPLGSSRFVANINKYDWTYDNIRDLTGSDNEYLIDTLGGIEAAKEIGYEPDEDEEIVHNQEAPSPINRLNCEVKKASARTATVALSGNYTLFQRSDGLRIDRDFKFELTIWRNVIKKITQKTSKRNLATFEGYGVKMDATPEILDGLLKEKNMTLNDVIQKGVAAIKEAREKPTAR